MKKIINIVLGLFLILYSCKEQELKPYSAEQDVSAVTRSQEAVYAPSIKSASLTETDKAILDKHLSKYTAFNINLKELTEYLKVMEDQVVFGCKLMKAWTLQSNWN
ncbi:MAG: hypothetical protein LBV47_08135 [Bacteroidales bacterium]|jgi:hypothetical protein|nr:hypothetical protein [Bacteroidales bacterium]